MKIEGSESYSIFGSAHRPCCERSRRNLFVHFPDLKQITDSVIHGISFLNVLEVITFRSGIHCLRIV